MSFLPTKGRAHCFKCGLKGHIARECRTSKYSCKINTIMSMTAISDVPFI